MSLFKLAAVGAVGYAIYKMMLAQQQQPVMEPAAFAPGEAAGETFNEVRNAGPDAMRSDVDEWDAVDQASDESFPASDPPSNY
ncbi:MAG: hypothetical protein KA533_09435 [Sphingobium sp.]|nr:hypothetical protein [Sphingobium sp.]MBP6112819.1 hypothetical protein [Sphingobium sp.]MBP8672048.1 hypothetical protein [Sphingobium sp.]MBP9158719.1 hypothetical protein [Sphingobium sp.]MCC6482807.1 hypothetical protein [Sphingomonadaceae bacterium]